MTPKLSPHILQVVSGFHTLDTPILYVHVLGYWVNVIDRVEGSGTF